MGQNNSEDPSLWAKDINDWPDNRAQHEEEVDDRGELICLEDIKGYTGAGVKGVNGHNNVILLISKYASIEF